MAKEVNKFMVSRVKAEVLEDVYNYVQREEEQITKHYGPTGEKRQSERYNRESGQYELQWEDEEQTVPRMEDVYDDVEYTEEELEERPEILAKKIVYQDILKTLEKML